MKYATLIMHASLLLAAPAIAQSNVDPVHKLAWQENTGWLNCRDAGAPVGIQGVRLHPSFFSGFVWGENIGYINFGDGTPGAGGGTSYANIDGTDFGVNRNITTGALSGLAWGENIGWINFSLPTLPAAQQPRFETSPTGGRLRGYAWGENIGWLNLDDANAFIGIIFCAADFNQSGAVTVQDIFDFLAAYFDNQPAADFNASGSVTVQDIFDFLAAYFAGCQ